MTSKSALRGNEEELWNRWLPAGLRDNCRGKARGNVAKTTQKINKCGEITGVFTHKTHNTPPVIVSVNSRAWYTPVFLFSPWHKSVYLVFYMSFCFLNKSAVFVDTIHNKPHATTTVKDISPTTSLLRTDQTMSFKGYVVKEELQGVSAGYF